jgi:hypothetical protein
MQHKLCTNARDIANGSIGTIPTTFITLSNRQRMRVRFFVGTLRFMPPSLSHLNETVHVIKKEPNETTWHTLTIPPASCARVGLFPLHSRIPAIYGSILVPQLVPPCITPQTLQPPATLVFPPFPLATASQGPRTCLFSCPIRRLPAILPAQAFPALADQSLTLNT